MLHKKLLALSISIVLLFSTSYMTYATYSPQDAIKESKAKFNQLSTKILDMNVEISNLNKAIDDLNEVISENIISIEENVKQIEVLEKELSLLEKEIQESQEIADKRLRAMYKNSYNKSYLSLLLTSKNFSDLYQKVEATERIAAMDRELLENLGAKKEELNNNLASLDLKRKQLIDLKNTNVSNLQDLNDKKTSLEKLIVQLDEEKKLAAAMIEENENKLIAHSISVIDSQNSSIEGMKGAISTLKSLIPQISTASVKKKAEEYLSTGNEKLTIMILNSKNAENNAGGNTTYKATYTMVATAYAGHTITAMGLKPVRDPDGLSTIAVDPSVIPLGTKVYIPGYGYAIASDTGGAIKGYKIDLFLNSNAECYKWGRRTVTLHVVAYPGEW
ncbi:3D domain-containing protein [Clostridium thermarum]|uniref:3D domain-containing protein n=1 Tax=Clostridium thermarum TaxID=1716543 RepID=UPI001FAB4BBD|nr:3D domain-containing protein [Clostridium thermarum]